MYTALFIIKDWAACIRPEGKYYRGVYKKTQVLSFSKCFFMATG